MVLARSTRLLDTSEGLLEAQVVELPLSETGRKVPLNEHTASSSLTSDARHIVSDRVEPRAGGEPGRLLCDGEYRGGTGSDKDFGLNAADMTEDWGYRVGKRMLDIVGAGLALILLTPLFVIPAVRAGLARS